MSRQSNAQRRKTRVKFPDVFGIVPESENTGTKYLRDDFTWDTPSGNSGGVPDGDKGDITVTGNGTIWTIENNAITNAKINDVAATKVTEDSTHRFATDTEKSTWNGKQDTLGFTPENTENKTDLMSGNSSSSLKFLSAKGVYDWVISLGYQLQLTSSNFGTFLNGLTAKTTPDDADEIVVTDSASSNVAKKITGTNFKAYLKTYFDTIYTTTSAVSSQITTALVGYATQSWVTSQGYVTNVISSLGYTPENSSNKENTTIDTNTTKYPTVNLLKTGLDSKQATLTNGFGITGTTTKAVSLTTAQAFCTAETTLSAVTYADITGASISLDAGTWLIMATVNGSSQTTTVAVMMAAITDGANAVVIESSQHIPAGTATVRTWGSLSLSAIVSPSGTTTYKLRGARGTTTQTGNWIASDGNGVNTANNVSNNSDKGTSIRAIRIA